MFVHIHKEHRTKFDPCTLSVLLWDIQLHKKDISVTILSLGKFLLAWM